MKNPLKGKHGIAFIEILLSLATLLIIGSFILRILFAREIVEWEDGIYRLIGIDPYFARFVIGTGALILIITVAVKRRFACKRNSLLD